MINVAFDMTFPNRNAAGSGVYARELLSELRERDDVTMLSVGAAAGMVSTLSWLAAGGRQVTRGSDLVHCPAYITPWRLQRPLVVTVHDTSIKTFPEDQPAEWRMYARFVLPERVRAAVRVITATEHTKRDIVRDLGVSEDRIVVTPYGVSQRFASVARPPKPPSQPATLLFPGAPVHRKNLDLVLRAMAQAPSDTKVSAARLVITGARAVSFPHYARMIETLGLTSRVDWRGPMPADLMPQVMADADVLVYPSWSEGFGFPPLEAMLASTPVVASNVSSMPEVLGDAALLVDPKDVVAFVNAVEAVLTRDELRENLVAKGRARASTYTWGRCAALTVEVYRAAVGQGPHG